MQMHTTRIPGLIITDHTFDVPLNYANPRGEQIAVFAREVVAAGSNSAQKPWLLYLQGGPGFEAPRPEDQSGWLKRALQAYRVLLLDQRGTGLSTPVNYQTLARFSTPQTQADYLKHFRADSIVQDAEFIRQKLLNPGEKWHVLGQSYGGFCLAHYLSVAPHALNAALFTGGLPPLTASIDAVYHATYKQTLTQNQRYYRRYPQDIARVKDIVGFLQANPTSLPGGGTLTPRRFQQLGFRLGSQTGFETIHYIVENAFVAGQHGRELNYAFLRAIEEIQTFETNPIYALLHESIYCEQTASNWSAERVRAEYPDFAISDDRPVYFTGEMIYPWMFDDYNYLAPLKETAEILAQFADWPALYNRQMLQANPVPCAAAVYYDDMYVARQLSEETAAVINGTHTWITNEYDHSALRMVGETILNRLLDMINETW